MVGNLPGTAWNSAMNIRPISHLKLQSLLNKVGEAHRRAKAATYWACHVVDAAKEIQAETQGLILLAKAARVEHEGTKGGLHNIISDR
jgi:hypothetical protein